MRLRWKYFIIRLELESKFRMRQLTLQAHLVRFNPHTSASAQQTRPGDVNKEMKCNCPMKAKLKEVSDRWCDGAAVCPREEEDSISWPFSHSVNARLPAGLFGSQRSWNCLLKWTFLKLNDFFVSPKSLYSITLSTHRLSHSPWPTGNLTELSWQPFSNTSVCVSERDCKCRRESLLTPRVCVCVCSFVRVRPWSGGYCRWFSIGDVITDLISHWRIRSLFQKVGVR